MTLRAVLVTGACGGIGRAVVEHFRADGWYVVGTDRVPPRLECSTDRFVAADLSELGAVAELALELADVGPLDAVINNAAVQVNAPLVETSDEQWAEVMGVNVRAAFQVIREFHDNLVAAGGAVVNVSSVHAIATSANAGAYAVSKAAIAALTRSAALELASVGVRCNAVLPGAVRTPMLEAGLTRRGFNSSRPHALADLAGRTPLGFVASPEQIAPTILHLADGRRSPYTTGQLFVLDGGATIQLSTER